MTQDASKLAGYSNRPRIMVVDDDAIVADSLAEFLRLEGYEAVTASSVEDAEVKLRAAEQGAPASGASTMPFAVVISDIALPGASGLELLRTIVREFRRTVCVMLTGYGTIEQAVEALRIGASDYLTKPVVDSELRLSLERALRQHALLCENQILRHQLEDKGKLENVIGADHRMARIFELVEAVAASRTTVLMCGESGTGKSLIAHAIHHRSPRANKPFVEISCGSIPETLLESELFGHVKGAFTGAHTDKVGRFLAADGGTLFLDEINSASPAMQLKLLRVLQERKFEPVGGSQTIEVDVRVILASNQPLEQLVAKGTFRQDLYYRINVVQIELPPLRDRVSDIPLLAQHMLGKHAAELGKQLVGFSPEALDVMSRYSYPGNVRELSNIVERAAVLCRRQTIGVEDLPAHVTGTTSIEHLGAAAADDSAWIPMSLEEALREPERRILRRALEANGWNRQKTAEQLQINRTTLYKKLKHLGLDPGAAA